MKELVTYRMEKLVIDRIVQEAADRGITRAELIEEWAAWCPIVKGGAKAEGSQKKSGGARKAKPFSDSPYAGQIYEDVPDEVANAKPAKKKLPVLPVPGVVRGTELKAPVKAVGLPGQVLDLATGRINRAPLLKPGQGK